MVQHGKIHSLTGLICHSCLEQLKCNNKATPSDRLGTVKAVVWG